MDLGNEINCEDFYKIWKVCKNMQKYPKRLKEKKRGEKSTKYLLAFYAT